MSELEQYLARATRHLWGRRRREAMAELRGNIHQAMLDHQLSGATPDEALRRALLDFGPPERASRAFGRVHSLPAVGRALLAALTLAGAYAAASIVHPQVQEARP